MCVFLQLRFLETYTEDDLDRFRVDAVEDLITNVSNRPADQQLTFIPPEGRIRRPTPPPMDPNDLLEMAQLNALIAEGSMIDIPEDED